MKILIEKLTLLLNSNKKNMFRENEWIYVVKQNFNSWIIN